MNNEKIEISIIIPCYNSFNKMEKCLNSLENQTYKNFEVIIIDDFSIDNSYEKMKIYKNNSNLNIKILRNEYNIGAGETRNKGIKNAVGNYIFFIDADDYISNDTLEKVSYIINNNSNEIDCIVFDYYKVKNNHFSRINMIENQKQGFMDTNIAFSNIKGCTCGKIYLKKIIVENNILFLNLKRNEDMPFTKIAISFCDNIFYYKEKPLYYYVMNETSLMHDKKLLNENNAIIAFETVKEKSNPKMKKNIENIFVKECLYSVLVSLLAKKKRKKYICIKIQQLVCNYPNWYKNIRNLNINTKIILFFYKINFFLPLRIIMILKEFIYD